MSGEHLSHDQPGTQLLATKLHVPRPGQGLVPRHRLVARLNEGAARPLILVSAPAGFGKTTLIAEWVQQIEGLQVAWLSLDEDDNDPARFLAYLIAALDALRPGLGTPARDLLAAPQPAPWKTVLTALLNGLATLPADFALVLDDYHAITEPAIHAALTYLTEHQPAQMHLVILSRADPALPLARLRARGQLCELREADLRFTPKEAAAFLNQAMRLDLSPADVAVLEAHTEGWIAGLQLAALCLNAPTATEQEDRSGFIAAFSGSNRFILDYLVEEVLARQPAPIQRFLLHTAVLDQLCGPLCEAVLGPDGGEESGGARGQAILQSLEQSNLFTIPLDRERRWYRYHHLFAEFLRSRLRQTEPALVPELHRRAAEWHEHAGYVAAAIGHALDGEDWEQAALDRGCCPGGPDGEPGGDPAELVGVAAG